MKIKIFWDQISISLNNHTLQIFIDNRIVAEISNCNSSYLNNDDFIMDVLGGLGYIVIKKREARNSD